jgi:Mg-chelatase subunit ChlD
MSLTNRRVLRHLSPAALLISCSILALSALAQNSPDPTEDSQANTTASASSDDSVAAARNGAAIPVATPRTAAINNSLSLGIVIDESSAMRADAAAVRSAVDKLVKPMGDDDEAFVVTAKDKPELLQDFTSDPEEISRKLDHLKSKGKTPLFDAIMTALSHLEDASNERTALVVIAAGDDDASSTSLETIRQKRDASRTPIYCIATKNTSWESQGVLQALAGSTGGSVLFPRRDKDFASASGEISRRLFGENALAGKEKPLAAYDLAVIKSIPVANGPDTANFPEGDNVILQKMLVKNLRAKGLFSQVIDGTTPDGVDQSKSAPQTSAVPLEVLGTVVEYKPATQRQTRLIRLGGRSALVKVQFLFRDARTGKIVMKSVKEGKVDTGVLGGSAEKVETQAVMRVVDRVVDEIARNR